MYGNIDKRLRKLEKETVKKRMAEEAIKRIKNRSINMGGDNDELKGTINAIRISQWKLAEALNKNESTFCRQLRHELDDRTKEKVYEILDMLIEVNT